MCGPDICFFVAFAKIIDLKALADGGPQDKADTNSC